MNKKVWQTIFFSEILFLFFWAKVNFASALELSYPTILGHSLNSTSSFSEYACYFFSLGVALSIIIAVLIIVFGGIYYLVSFGRGKFTDEGKSWIKAGITGLLIVVCASLIANTINPDLATCKTGILPKINFNIFSNPSVPFGADVKTFKEIPIGTLTENLLTKTMDCYGFDQEGNPVNGEQIGNNKNLFGPTYLNHDRADCLAQLIDGSQKKSEVIANLSSEISKLMNTCSCSNPDGSSKCQPVCDPEKGCQPNFCGPGGSCTGSCVGGACKEPTRAKDCCPEGVKDKIEHGPVSFSFGVSAGQNNTTCETENKIYKGLDEFRCPVAGLKIQQCSNIANQVEKKTQLNGRTVIVIDQSKWGQLNLTQQLTYFTEKIDEIKQKIKDDEAVLDSARDTLGNCYLAMPYVDLLKKYQNTDQTKHILINQKIFPDPETNQKIDASKYCEGFNYENSSCLSKCNDLCPDSSPEAMQLYKNCSNAENQEECIKNAYNSRPCSNSLSENPPKNFGSCISECQNSCTDNCSEKYLPCSEEYDLCKSQCKNDSQCVLDNASSCLINAKKFNDCSTQSTDQGNADFCINNAYLCKNGSDQYAGYPDCVDQTIKSCPANVYSSSFLFETYSVYGSHCDKCPDPYGSAINGTACYSSKAPDTACQTICPETSKCPPASACADCPCDQITDHVDQTKPLNINFSIPNISNKNNSGQEDYTTQQQAIFAFQMAGPQCTSHSYNDDPLTFYCENNWWTNPDRDGISGTPEGEKYKVDLSSKGEIPVGQAVDDAKNWADELVEYTDKMQENIQTVIGQMYKAGKAKDTDPIQDYCKCGAKFEDSSPVCKTGCQYNLWQVPIFGNRGIVGWQWDCSCNLTSCTGNPCEQVTDYLSELWNSNRQFKLDFIDFYTEMLTEPRSDIMKELSYSRQAVNACSSANNALGSETKLLNCTRIKDEIISPANSGPVIFDGESFNVGCYGNDLGLEVDKSLTDNWFCGQKYGKQQ